MPPSSPFAANLARVRAELAELARATGRGGEEVTIVAVTKGRRLEECRLAHEAGLVLAENRVQEAETKVAQLPQASWHLIGHLQTNKARRAAAVFAVIQSLDDPRLAARLGAARPGLPVFLEVKATEEPAKHGCSPADAVPLAAAAAAAGLSVAGVMGMGPAGGDAEPAFRLLARCHAELEQRLGRELELSMGMSSDYRQAVRCGSTMVRLGRALFEPASTG